MLSDALNLPSKVTLKALKSAYKLDASSLLLLPWQDSVESFFCERSHSIPNWGRRFQKTFCVILVSNTDSRKSQIQLWFVTAPLHTRRFVTDLKCWPGGRLRDWPPAHSAGFGVEKFRIWRWRLPQIQRCRRLICKIWISDGINESWWCVREKASKGQTSDMNFTIRVWAAFLIHFKPHDCLSKSVSLFYRLDYLHTLIWKSHVSVNLRSR